MTQNPGLSQLILYVVLGYVAVLVLLGWLAQRRVEGLEDYVVAGRRLPLSLAAPTLLATWYGAGTLLTAADEVRLRGLSGATLDPLGAGLCLFIAGWVFAGPMWRLKLLTLPELFARRYGPRAEVASALLMLPQYFGWVAAQFMALAGMLQLFFGLPIPTGIVLVCALGAGYTLLGGMWAVTLTDALQIVLVLVGLTWMVFSVLSSLGGGDAVAGATHLFDALPPAHLSVLDSTEAHPLVGFLAVLAAGALGNLPSQDLMQRVLSSRSEAVARRACLLAGAAYWLFGALPVVLGLAAYLLDVDMAHTVLPLLASQFLHPAGAVIFVVTLLSAVLSTIDSALLAPATVLSLNVAPRVPGVGRLGTALGRTRLAVVLVALLSLVAAFAGETAYGLLESTYELGMVSLLAPMCLALFYPRRSERAILVSMACGTGPWLVHLLSGTPSLFGWDALGMPVGLGCTGLSVAGYFATLAAGGGASRGMT